MGPFYIKIHTLRQTKTEKVYLCIFICFVSEVVHLEVATDLLQTNISLYLPDSSHAEDSTLISSSIVERIYGHCHEIT